MHRVDYHHIRLYARRLGKYFVNVWFRSVYKARPNARRAARHAARADLPIPRPKRKARGAFCRGSRLSAKAAWICRCRGSPVSSTTEPRTRPPPSTRSSSPSPVTERTQSPGFISSSFTARLPPLPPTGKGAPRLSRRRFCFFGGRQLFDRILDKGIPCAALRAFSEPFGAFAAAGRADVYRFYTFHRLAPFLFLTSLYTIFTGQSIGGVPFGSR